MNTEVLIVGAGPTGLSLAAQFVRYGVDFIIIDKKEGVTTLSKALAVHARTLEIYEQMDLSQTAIERGTLIQKMNLLSEGKVRAELDFTGIGTNMSPYPYVLTLEQSENERLLNEFIQKNGKQVWWQTALEGISQDENGVKATVKSNDGSVQEIAAKYLVGCDGASSETRSLLGLGFAGTTIPHLFYVADVEMESELHHDTLYPAFGPDSFVLFFPMRGGDKHWRLIGNMPEHEGKEELPEVDYEEIEAKVKQISQIPLDITNVLWFSSYKVHTRHAESFIKGRCMLAGDAAHIHTPAGGQGMNTGIQDAYNLAWKLAFVLRGYAKEPLLESYNLERIANARRLLRTTDQLFDFASGDEWYFRMFREHILPPLAKVVLHFDTAKEFIFPTLSQIGISYDKQPLSRHGSDMNFKIKAGNRFPYFLVDGKNCFDYLREPKFKLVTFLDGTENAAEGGPAELPEWIERVTFPLYPHVTDLFGSKHTFSVLLRPDNHVGFIDNGNGAGELSKYLAENLGKV
jgi:2-polyprenyl-6-methoxyphenol hydroxylase-like FAD-dependent oxidoreductase